MALGRCSECKKEVSTLAKSCPHCGAPFQQKTSGCAWVAAVFCVLFLIGFISNLVDDAQYKPKEADLTLQQQIEANQKREQLEKAASEVLWDIKVLSGLYPASVEKILGKHTASEKTKYGLKYTYRDGEVEIVFIDGVSDWITISPPYPGLPFNESSLQALGIRATTPDFSTDDVKRWTSIPNFISISFSPTRQGKIDFIYIKKYTE